MQYGVLRTIAYIAPQWFSHRKYTILKAFLLTLKSKNKNLVKFISPAFGKAKSFGWLHFFPNAKAISKKMTASLAFSPPHKNWLPKFSFFSHSFFMRRAQASRQIKTRLTGHKTQPHEPTIIEL